MDFTRKDLDAFDKLIKEAYDKPWWRAYIEQIIIRKTDCLNELSDPGSDLTQRQEDRLRGCIISYNFTLSLDEIAKQHAINNGKRVVTRDIPQAQEIENG